MNSHDGDKKSGNTAGGSVHRDRPRSIVRGVLHGRIVQNALALYGAQFANYVIPLMLIPYLSRTLGPAVFGKVALAQAVGIYLILVVEFGFNLSATRDVARHRDSKERLATLMASVTSAKMVLATTSIAVLALLQTFFDGLHSNGAFIWAGAFWGIAMGFRPLWMFLGLEELRTVTVVDVVAKAVAAAGIIVLVRSPDDGLLVLVLQGGGAFVSTCVATVLAYRRAPFRPVGISAAFDALRTSWNVFASRIAINVYTSSNVFMLGFLSAPQVVGFYAGAEKLFKASVNLFDPLSQVLYPSASRTVAENRNQAARRARAGILAFAVVGLIGAAATYLLSPLVIPLFLGPQFGPAVHLLQILGLMLPIVGVSISVVYQWLFPIGRDRTIARISIMAGAFHVTVALALGSRFGAEGVAWALVATEILVMGSMLGTAARSDLFALTLSWKRSSTAALAKDR